MTEEQDPDTWFIPASEESKKIVNTIKQVVDGRRLDKNPDKDVVNLSIGDPTVHGFTVHETVKEAVRSALDSDNFNGLGPAHGLLCARQAVARYHTSPEAPLTEDDIVMGSGCTGALDLCFTVLGNPGQNLLIPLPTLPFYTSTTIPRGLVPRYYNLLPDRQWEADLDQMEQLIDKDTVAIVVVNPSNPCGSVFSRQHLLDILAVAEKHSLPIIADEIYTNMTFKDQPSYPIASLSKNVPVLSCGGLGKLCSVPGWRVGWILVHDRHQRLTKEVIPSLLQVAQKILGPSTLLQAALPQIFDKLPQSYIDQTMIAAKADAEIAYNELSVVAGLKPYNPTGAMYMMIGVELSKFPHINSTVEFMEKLMFEESVFILPGECFKYPGFIRLVLLISSDKMREACCRIREFCNRHYQA